MNSITTTPGDVGLNVVELNFLPLSEDESRWLQRNASRRAVAGDECGPQRAGARTVVLTGGRRINTSG